MRIDMAGILNNKEQMLHCLARENVVPVKAPSWSKYPFELRNGRHMFSQGLIPKVMELLGVHDQESCKEIRNRIKLIRQAAGYK